MRQMFKVFRNNIRAMQDYSPQPLNNRVRLIRVVDPAAQDERDPMLGWSGFAEEVETVAVQGNHSTILSEPHVAVVARQLKLWLEQTQSQDI